ncbi:hypothetical protein [Paraburkholderia diazotrophica]|uniref:hypothetical protein n=1 Tax=Paraburkholderia diazotrophica TaxID=667676 RepID=UPI003173D6D3
MPYPDPIPTPERVVVSIPEFCTRYRIGKTFYYSLRAKRKGPRELRLSARPSRQSGNFETTPLADDDNWRQPWRCCRLRKRLNRGFFHPLSARLVALAAHIVYLMSAVLRVGMTYAPSLVLLHIPFFCRTGVRS